MLVLACTHFICLTLGQVAAMMAPGARCWDKRRQANHCLFWVLLHSTQHMRWAVWHRMPAEVVLALRSRPREASADAGVGGSTAGGSTPGAADCAPADSAKQLPVGALVGEGGGTGACSGGGSGSGSESG